MSKGAIPPGGWYFVQGHTILRSGDIDGLVGIVEAHRISNKIPLGNVRGDVEDQICQRFPDGCTGVIATGISELAKFNAAMQKWGNMGNQAVAQGEADRRAEICATCHNNQNPAGGCKTCNAAKNIFLEGVRKLKIGHRTVSQQDKLKNCAICSCLNTFQVHVPLEVFGLTDQDRLLYPDFCWKKGLP